MAQALLIMAAQRKLLILCARETQASIKESVHRLLETQIERLGLSSLYEVQKQTILCKTGSEFIFAGIRTDPNKIKSTEGIDICWVTEAAKVSETSWKILIPTIRKEGSEIWVDFNPDLEDDPTTKRFMINPPPKDYCTVVEMNWEDNPWFSETLRKEKDYDYKVDPESAAHVWGGKFRQGSQAQIFGPTLLPDGTRKPKYIVEDFEAEEKNKVGELVPKAGWNGPYFGADWGFSPDPVTLVKLWIFDAKLYIEYEIYAVGVELNEIATLWDTIPGARKHTIRADSSRPETISHVRNYGFDVVGAEKWPGSVEDGIAWMRNFELIVIHPRCKHSEEEFRLYRKKTDPITGDVLPIIIDKHNHTIDADRYAMEPAIKAQVQEQLVVHEEQVTISSDLDELEARGW